MTHQPFDIYKEPPLNWWKEDSTRLDQLRTILARDPIPYVSDIVLEMHAPSRSVIIGMAHRKGLKLRAPHISEKPRMRDKTRIRKRKLYVPRVHEVPNFLATTAQEKARMTSLAKIAKRQAEDESAAQTTGIPFHDIADGKCRWPLTEVNPISDFRFCGMETKGIYCGHHTRRSIARYTAEAAE